MTAQHPIFHAKLTFLVGQHPHSVDRVVLIDVRVHELVAHAAAMRGADERLNNGRPRRRPSFALCSPPTRCLIDYTVQQSRWLNRLRECQSHHRSCNFRNLIGLTMDTRFILFLCRLRTRVQRGHQSHSYQRAKANALEQCLKLR